MKTQKNNQIAQKATDLILEAIDNGQGLNWLKPWNPAGYMNIKTGARYSGFNQFFCHIYSVVKGYNTPFFITQKAAMKMAKESGEFWEFDNPKQTMSIAVPMKVKDKKKSKERGEDVFFIYFKSVNVYNIEQIKGWEEKFAAELAEYGQQVNEPIADAETFCFNYIKNENIRYITNQTRACYFPDIDTVSMPSIHSFINSANFYKALLHEFVHTTEIEKRLNRVNRKEDKSKATYAREEITAEIASLSLASQLGLTDFDMERNTNEYLANWGRVIRNNPDLIFQAAKNAAKAEKYIKKAAMETVTA